MFQKRKLETTLNTSMLKNYITLLITFVFSKYSSGQIADNSSNHKLKLIEIS